MDAIKFTTERHENYVYIKLDEARLNTTNAPQLKSEFAMLNAQGRKNIILDLGNVEYADSSGLSALLRAKKWFAESGGLFLICGLTPHVQKLIQISQLDKTLDIVDNKQTALKVVLQSVLDSEEEEPAESQDED